MVYPKFTVLSNLGNGKWIGTSWEFFDDIQSAEECYKCHIGNGNCPTLRPFHENDIKHLGAAHRYSL